MKIRDNTIYGTNYYTTARNGYSCIDGDYGDSIGGVTLLAGVKPKSLVHDINIIVNDVQRDSMQELLLAVLAGESANSEDLYIYTTNTSAIYNEWLQPAIKKLKILLDNKSDKALDWNSLIDDLYMAFRAGSKHYNKEFECEGEKNFTKLDIYTCVYQWIEANKIEYKCNGLE